MAVRSDYIKKLMETKNSLEKEYQEVVAESMQNIIGDNAKEEVRKLLKETEDEDSFEEEEVDTDTDAFGDDEVEDDEVDTDGADDIMDDLESCKSADGEYDCRGMDDDKLIKVLNSMGPEDGIRVMSNGDGSVSVEVDGDKIEGTKEFVIDLDDFEDDVDDDIESDFEDADEDFEDDVDDDVEVEVEDEPEDEPEDESEDEAEVELELNEGDVDLGYTDSYQHDTAMTVDNNDETANPKTTYSMDAGVPKGTKKPWAQDGDRQPYDKNVNEDVDECGDTIFEVEEDIVDEAARTQGGKDTSVGRGVTMSREDGNDWPANQRNGRSTTKGQVTRTTNAYQKINADESLDIRRKMHKLYNENKQMKSIVPQLQQKLMESMVINQSMGYIVRLLNENTTSVDEKKQISERFSKVNTLEEGKKLYETISEELKQVGKRNNMNGVINGQLAEGKQAKQNLVETTMYKSEKVNETLDFMKRLNAIK